MGVRDHASGFDSRVVWVRGMSKSEKGVHVGWLGLLFGLVCFCVGLFWVGLGMVCLLRISYCDIL